MSRTARRDEAVAAWSALMRAHVAVLDHLERHLRDAKGLPLAWYDVLLELEHAPDRRLRMQDLGTRAVLSRSRVSRIVDQLVEAGFVGRQIDPDDGRGFYAVMTAAGRSRFRRAAPTYVHGIEEHFAAHLSDHELAVIRKACEHLAASGGLDS